MRPHAASSLPARPVAGLIFAVLIALPARAEIALPWPVQQRPDLPPDRTCEAGRALPVRRRRLGPQDDGDGERAPPIRARWSSASTPASSSRSSRTDGGSCVFPDGDLENLSHYVQAYYKLPTYFTPVLVGYSAGASLAYATLAQAPRGVLCGRVVARILCGPRSAPSPSARPSSSSSPPARKAVLAWCRRIGCGRHGSCSTVPRIRCAPRSEAREFATQTRNAHYVELPNVGHYYRRSPEWMPQFKSSYAALMASGAKSLPPPPPDLAELPLDRGAGFRSRGREERPVCRAAVR